MSGTFLPQAHLEKTETEMLELSQNGVNLRSNFKELKEMKHVLEKAQTFMAEVGRQQRGRSPAVASTYRSIIIRSNVFLFLKKFNRLIVSSIFFLDHEDVLFCFCVLKCRSFLRLL